MFVIPQLVFDTYNNAVDAMIDSNFGVNCRLYYPAEKTICSNCEFNPIIGRSANIYKAGGPISFTDGFCPFCNGDGYTDDSRTEDIMLRCYFTPKHWIKIINDSKTDMKYPDGAMQTIGHLSDLQKCRRANYITVNTNVAGYINSSYGLIGEPVLHGFQRNKFFIAMWERTN